MPNPNIEGKTTKGIEWPILGSGEISSAYEKLDIFFIYLTLR